MWLPVPIPTTACWTPSTGTSRSTTGGRLAAGSSPVLTFPTPGISQRRAERLEFDLDPDLDIHLDGVRIGRGRHLEVTVEPDALICVV